MFSLLKPFKNENKGLSYFLGLARCKKCDGRSFPLVDNLCSDCWYEIHGKGKHIWEIWDELGYEPSKKIKQLVNTICPNHYKEGG